MEGGLLGGFAQDVLCFDGLEKDKSCVEEVKICVKGRNHGAGNEEGAW